MVNGVPVNIQPHIPAASSNNVGSRADAPNAPAQGSLLPATEGSLGDNVPDSPESMQGGAGATQTVHLNLGSTTMAVPVPSGASIQGPDPDTQPPSPSDVSPGGQAARLGLPINGQTLSAGGAPLVIGTNTLSVASNGLLNLDGTLTNPAAATTQPHGGPPALSASASINSVLATLSPGGSPAVIQGQTISRDGVGAFVAGTSTFLAATQAGAALAGAATQEVANVIQNLAPGQTTQLNGYTLSHNAQDSLVVDGTQTLALSAAPSVILNPPSTNSQDVQAIRDAATGLPVGSTTTIDGHTISALPSGGFILDGQSSFSSVGALASAISAQSPGDSPEASLASAASSLAPGSSTSVSGHVLSAASDGAVVLDGTSTLPFAVFPAQTQAPAIAALSSALSTLQPGSPPLTIASHTVSRGPNGNFILDDSATATNILDAASALGSIPAQAVLFSALATLAPGSITTIGGETISNSKGAIILLDGTSSLSNVNIAASLLATLEPNVPSKPTITPAPGLSILSADISALWPGAAEEVGGATISRATNGVYVVNGQTSYTAISAVASALGSNVADAALASDILTLSAGSVTTVGGHAISHSAGGNYVVDGTSTYTNALAAATAVDHSAALAQFSAIASALPAGQAELVDGQTISRVGNGYIVDGTSVTNIAAAATAIEQGIVASEINTMTIGAAMTINGHVVSKGGNGYVLDGTKTLGDVAAVATAIEGGGGGLVTATSPSVKGITGTAPTAGPTGPSTKGVKAAGRKNEELDWSLLVMIYALCMIFWAL